MSFLAFCYWLVGYVRRMGFSWKKRPVPTLPEWPVGASVCLCLHEFRPKGDEEFGERPPTVRFTLRLEEEEGSKTTQVRVKVIRDQYGRSLDGAAIYTKTGKISGWNWFRRQRPLCVPEIRRHPDDILRILGADVFSGQLVRFVFTDANVLRQADAPYARVGVTVIDATCMWIESSSGFASVPAEPVNEELEFAVAS